MPADGETSDNQTVRRSAAIPMKTLWSGEISLRYGVKRIASGGRSMNGAVKKWDYHFFAALCL